MNAVEIARKALYKLAELGLPPTPENYDAQFRSIAGESPCASAATPVVDDSARRLGMLRTLLQVMTSANADLHQDLTRFAAESSLLLQEVESKRDPESIGELFSAMTSSSSWLLGEVDQMRKELERTREQLDAMSSELREAQHLAISDPLTGLPNRRGIDSTLNREISRARRHKVPLCLSVLDLDHFKQINDSHGHVIGDMALIHVAHTLKGSLRDVDLLARFGGEEFMVIMPDTALMGAEFGVNRLLQYLLARPLIVDQLEIPLCFSAGVAQWTFDESVLQLIARTDKALYAAKAAGRSRVAVAPAGDEAVSVTQQHKG